MKYLVTGCAGFIGWKVTEFLLEAGHTVVGIDNINKAYDTQVKQWRLQQLEGIQTSNFIVQTSVTGMLYKQYSRRVPLHLTQ